ncbi:MAG: hypothetical protein ABW168_14885 [Sedimenticola sp.]
MAPNIPGSAPGDSTAGMAGLAVSEHPGPLTESDDVAHVAHDGRFTTLTPMNNVPFSGNVPVSQGFGQFYDPGMASLQCGQQVNIPCDQMTDLAGSSQSGLHTETGETFTAVAYNDEVIVARLDHEVNGLPKDMYIETLLTATHSCEETLAMYRIKLAERAKQCDNGPKGTLINRKNTNKSCISEKYAIDCHSLSQFLNGSRPDVDDVIKHYQSRRRDTINSTRTESQTENVAMQSEIAGIKNSIVSLLTDVNMLKSDMSKIKSDISAISSSMKKDIKSVQKELLQCKANIDKNLFPNLASHEEYASKSLSEGIAKISTMVNGLEKNRNALAKRTSEIDVSVRDNMNGIEQLRDMANSGNSTLKSRVKDIEQKQTETQTLVKTTQKQMSDNESAINRSVLTVDTVKRQVKDVEKGNTKSMSKMEDCFRSLSIDLCEKINEMCSTVIDITKTAHNVESNTGASSTAAGSRANGHEPAMFNMPGLAQMPNTLQFTRENPNSVPPGDPPLPKSKPAKYNTRTNAHVHTIEIDDTDSIVSIESDSRPVAETPAVVSIECRLSDKQNDKQVNAGSSRFRAVVRHNLAKYYVGNIDLDATDDDFHEFLQEFGVKCTQLTLFNSRNSESLSAYIAIWDEHSHIVEDSNFWPDGVTCRHWITRPQTNRRRNTRNDHNGGYNQY